MALINSANDSELRRAWRNRLILSIALLATGVQVDAEPWFAVAEGMQCSACHSHPAGGGLRTTFGNTYAQTILPADRLGDPEAPLWTGEVLDWLAVGGNLRAEYRYVDTPNAPSVSEFDVVRGTVYAEARIIPNRLSIYLDQQVAPGGSLNREAYVRLNSTDQRFYVSAGQFFLPYGLRLQDDSAFIRQVTGVNFTTPDRGIQAGFESGAWSTQLSLTNGNGGASETDTGKQVSVVINYVRQRWRVGTSFNTNDATGADRKMANAFLGLRTGPIAWLGEIDWITDEIDGAGETNAVAGLLEGNWRFRQGHNVKLSYDYFDPDNDISEDHQVRYSLLYEYTPIQYLQTRLGIRYYDGVPQVDAQNRDEYFVELHGFF